ncbi:hypothetical protein CBL_04607 [Carabus blaptoides fortunei]
MLDRFTTSGVACTESLSGICSSRIKDASKQQQFYRLAHVMVQPSCLLTNKAKEGDLQTTSNSNGRSDTHKTQERVFVGRSGCCKAERILILDFLELIRQCFCCHEAKVVYIYSIGAFKYHSRYNAVQVLDEIINTRKSKKALFTNDVSKTDCSCNVEHAKSNRRPCLAELESNVKYTALLDEN